VGSTSYDDNLNFEGQPMPPAPQAKYVQGEEIEVEIVLTAHHMGHFEFSVCPLVAGGVASGDCFAQYPLEFVADPLYGAPKDTKYPNRAYIAPPALASATSNLEGTPELRYLFRLQLPDNLVGDLVLLQWHYLTANSCTYAGYDSYAFPADWGAMQSGVGVCKTISPDGNGAPGTQHDL
jgi:Lytic polysaccharide mono-oxygenase, cellulose-degrading